jgi:tetratricopeptide (TPR) repeat protein
MVSTNFARGVTLCNEIKRVVAALWEGKLPATSDDLVAQALQAKEQRGFCDQYHYLLLDLTYLHQYFPPPAKQSDLYDGILHVSRATYDRHLREAIRRLGELLLLHLQPTLHVEQPIVTANLVGRAALRAEALTLLRAEKSIYLCGASGIGKSALGAAITELWATPAIFWFTVRVTVNDRLTSLLFALGNFLHQQGASRLWLQLVANAGIVKDANLALDLARADLAALPHLPLLCLDEIDLLRPVDIETEPVHHTQFLAFVEGLQGYAPLLFMGQRTVLAADRVFSLTRLSDSEIAEWLTHANVHFTPELLTELNDYTAGNPRLLALCLVLYQSSNAQQPADLRSVLNELPQTPALEPIWQRLQQRLGKREIRLLQALSVFRSPTPRDAWHHHAASLEIVSADSDAPQALQRLISYRLIQEDGQGGVAVLPALRAVVYQQLTAEQREELHCRAALIRAERGEYTAAAYHYQQGDQPLTAIAVWEPNYEQEVRRGQAAAALAIFQQISCHRLPQKAAQTLRLLRSRLYQLGGHSAQALAEVETMTPADAEWAVEAAVVGGDALRTLGQTDHALAHYGEGLAGAAHLLQRTTWLHAKRGTVYLQQRELHHARREALQARYGLENLEGAIHETAGNYGAARQHYLNALNAAELLDDKRGLALVQRNLGVLAAHQNDQENAVRYHLHALLFYEEIGDRVSAEEVRSNLAGVYVQFKEFTAAIEPATKALAFFTIRQNSFWIAQNTSNLATVYYELGDFAQAQHYAEETLTQEEPQSYPYALFTLGQVCRAQQHWQKAEAYFAEVQKIAQQTEDHFLLAQLAELVTPTPG